MPEQPTLFHEKQKPRANEDGFVWVQEAPQGSPETDANMYAPQDSAPQPLAAQARREAFRRLQKDGKDDTLRAEYARWLYRAMAGEVAFNGKVVRDLTDKEAAHLMGRPVQSVTGRRATLMGRNGKCPEYEACPVVEESRRRRSHVADYGHRVTAYRIKPTLFTQPD